MRVMMIGTLGLIFGFVGAAELTEFSELTEQDFEDSYDDYAESPLNPPPSLPCSLDLSEILELDDDLVGSNVSFLFWAFDGAQNLDECPGDVQTCHLEALYAVAPNYTPPSQGGQQGPYDFMPNQVGIYMDALTTCLTKDTNEGIVAPSGVY